MSEQLASLIKHWGETLGFDRVAITDTNLSSYIPVYQEALQRDNFGGMDFLKNWAPKQLDIKKFAPFAKTIICARINYFTEKETEIARFAHSDDYHVFIKQLLEELAEKIKKHAGDFHYKITVDSAPILEKALAEKAGLGWTGKNGLLVHPTKGSFSFLGEIITDLDLPIDEPIQNQCGDCQKCLKACPTDAFIAPGQLDASRCIAYLTIEHCGSIPVEFRTKIGNRVLGCDACQSACPFNQQLKQTQMPIHPSFSDSHSLEWFTWDKKTFLKKTIRSSIHRLGYERFLRNIAVALGNRPYDPKIVETLKQRENDNPPLIREHVQWALKQQLSKQSQKT